MAMKRQLLCASLCAAVAFGRGPLPVPEFEINLDLAPEDRFTKVIEHFAVPLSELFTGLVNNSLVLAATKQIAEHRGPENDELMGEIRGISRASGFPMEAIQAAQVIYELQSLMVPFNNFTFPYPTNFSALPSMWTKQSSSPLFGCTGIIARNSADGTVYHARNLDFSFAKYLQNMAYNGIFTKGGKELFTAQMIAGYSMIITGIRRGSNGYSVEINTRYTEHVGGNVELLKNIFGEKRTSSGWTKRKIMENIDNYEDAVEALSTTPYIGTEYNIISGVQKGTILARNPDGLGYKMDLGDKRYIIITNFDYIYHDLKEWFDPTGGKGVGHPRRLGAEKILNSSDVITPELLFTVLNDEQVIAKDTIFQAIINVEKDLWNTSLPFCRTCAGYCPALGQCRKKKETCCTVRDHYTLSCGTLGGYRCGCLADDTCRFPRGNMTEGDEDCCSLRSHATLACASGRKCGGLPDGACVLGLEAERDCFSGESHFTLACPGSTRRCGKKTVMSPVVV